MSAVWVTLLTVAVATFCHGSEITEVIFPQRNKCSGTRTLTYQTAFQSIEVDSNVYTRYLTAGTTCVESSESEVFDVQNVIDCAIHASDNGYNSFTYKKDVCTCYSYFAKKCGARPLPLNDGKDDSVWIVDKKRRPFRTGIFDVMWRQSSESSISVSYKLYGVCSIDKVVIELINGTCIEENPKREMTSIVEIEEATSTGQDVIIRALDFKGKVLDTYKHKRDVCGTEATDVDFFDHCVKETTEQKVKFLHLKSYCINAGSAIPIINKSTIRDLLIQIAETNGKNPFWTSYMRCKDGRFRWPDGSTDISKFDNYKSFKAGYGQDCTVARLNPVTMRLEINAVPCLSSQFGFCLRKAS